MKKTCRYCGIKSIKVPFKKVHRRDHPWGLTIWGSYHHHPFCQIDGNVTLVKLLTAAYSCNIKASLDGSSVWKEDEDQVPQGDWELITRRRD